MKRQSGYLALLILASAVIIGLSIKEIWMQPFKWDFDILFLLFLFVICRTFPVYTKESKQIDLSLVPAAAGVFLHGLDPTLLLFLISTFFLVEHKSGSNQYRLLLLSSPKKQLLSLASSVLGIWGAGIFLRLFGQTLSDFSTADLIVHILTFLLIASVIEILVYFFFIIANRQARVVPTMSRLAGKMLWTLLFTCPLGVLTTFLLSKEYGYWYLLLFLVPAGAARCTYKLYLDGQRMHMRTIGALSRVVEAKDPYTRGHSQRVAFLSEEIAREMRLSPKVIEEIKVAALLHDIGKIGVDERILNKPGMLTPEEFEQVKRHPVLGREMIAQIGFSRKVSEAIEYHHCYYDGSGYPVDQIMYKNVPIGAAILSIADAYDAMTSDRPYRRRVTDETALRVLRENAGKQFDPQVVEAFTAILATQFELEEEPNTTKA